MRGLSFTTETIQKRRLSVPMPLTLQRLAEFEAYITEKFELDYPKTQIENKVFIITDGARLVATWDVPKG